MRNIRLSTRNIKYAWVLELFLLRVRKSLRDGKEKGMLTGVTHPFFVVFSNRSPYQGSRGEPPGIVGQGLTPLS